ncbi:MAG: hypothetical protein GX117_10285 [Candidatus Hydrogenedentes bacterium]|nr:hypothetical protein [Candidatus Hydrogenedentota bacterium]
MVPRCSDDTQAVYPLNVKIRRFCTYSFLAAIALSAGCASTTHNHPVFSNNWKRQMRSEPRHNRRSAPTQEQLEETKQLGPMVISHDESGRPKVSVGGKQGVGVDMHYRRGPSARLRYRRDWNFAKPRHRR